MRPGRRIAPLLLIVCAAAVLAGCMRRPATDGPYANVVDVFLADNAGFQSLMQGLPDFSTVYIHAPESGEAFSRQNDPGSVTGDAYVLLQGKQHIEIIGVANSFGEKPIFRQTIRPPKQIFAFADCQHLTVSNIAFETNRVDSLWFTDVSFVDLFDISHDGVVGDSAIRFNHQAVSILIDRWDIQNIGTDFSLGTPAQQDALSLIYNQDASAYGGFTLQSSGGYDKPTKSYDWNIIQPVLDQYGLFDDNGLSWTAAGLQQLVDSVEIGQWGINWFGETNLMQNITISNGFFDMVPGSLSMNAINLDIRQGPGVVEDADANENPAGSNAWIRNNTFRHFGHSAIAASRWADINITGNVFLDQSGQPLRSANPAVHIENSKDFSVAGNSFVNVRTAVDLLTFWRNGRVMNNTVSGVREEAVLVRGRSKFDSDLLEISGNKLDQGGCPERFPTDSCVGILLAPVQWAAIEDVSISYNVIENAIYGVGSLDGHYLDVRHNTIRNVDYGVGLAGGAIVDVIDNQFSNVAIENVGVDPAFTGSLTIR